MAFAVLGLLLVGAKTGNLSPEKVIERWKDGPIRYIMTGKEEEEVLGLKSVEELARFITRFWARRDPSPGTFENEYRRLFWQRVGEANKRFRVSTTPGWKTDRGKIFIILGEPFDVEKDRGQAERWEYRRKYSRTADPVFYVVFSWSHGELELDHNPATMSPFYDFQGLVLDPGPIGVTAEIQAAIAEAQSDLAGTAIGATFDLGDEVTAAISNTEIVLATVSTHDFVSAFTATPKFEFFRAKDGSTFVNVCGLMKARDLYGQAASGVSHQRVYVSLSPVDASKQTLFATNEKNPSTFDLSKGPEPGGLVAVWTGVAVPPGRYAVTLAIEDSLTGRLGRAAADLQVPDFSGPALSVSTPVLASSLSGAKDRMSVTARSSSVFRRSEDFGVYYEVYGLTDRTEHAPFDASYRFYKETPAALQPVGQAIAFTGRTEASQGWSFPLAKWPAGKYRIEITVTDANGRSAATTASFEVVE